jgi:Trypsin-like serine proteases, typically periplasmic, contain C-terminal PDZ domain
MGRHKYDLGEVVRLIFKDAMYTSIAKFMNQKAVKEHLQQQKQASPDYEALMVKSGDSIKSPGEAKKATVTVKGNKQQHGSGFVIGRNGYIITNYSVVSDQSKDKKDIQVFLGKGQKVKAELVRKNAYMDLALIKVDQKFAKTFRIPSKSELEGGSTAFAIGTPGSIELGQTVTKGIVSGVRNLEGNKYIQSDVSVNPGSSGGPLIKENGRLLGVVTDKLTGIATEGISFSLQARLLDNHLGLNYKAN